MGRITLTNVDRAFGKLKVLHDINLDIQDGEFLVLVGPSGCGKSTLLRLIAGLDRPSAGTIEINGADVTRVTAAERGLAMVFQSYALYPHMTVRQNLAFGLENIHMPKAEIEERIREAARMLEITDYLGRRPGQLSGGQKQRVAIGRAVVRNPTAFLLDEPLSNLDAELRISTRAELSALHGRLKTTMIYVTHDQVEAMTMGDRVCIMSHGKVAQIGKPMDVYLNPASTFVASFLGNPPMNLMPAKVTGSVAETGSGRIACIGLGEGRSVTLGLRPEDLRPTDHASEAVISGRVTSLESLGAETLVHVDTGNAKPVILRGGRETPAHLDEPLHLTCDPKMARFFDPETGLAIISGENK